MKEKCQLTALEIGSQDVMNRTTVANAVSEIGSLNVDRLIVTDRSGLVVYDSSTETSLTGRYLLLPEVVRALKMNNVFTCSFQSGTMQSHAASPIVSYGLLIGCVYMIELDAEQGALIETLQNNILAITIVLELAVILFSVAFSSVFSSRLRRIMASMHIIREGDYTHKVEMGGNDELTVLGNEFNDLVNRLQVSESKRRQFVSDASHELKTPLASIKLLADSILQNDMDNETINEFVTDIGNEAERLNKMSLKLLSLSRIESQSDYDCEIINIAPTIEKVVRMLSAIAQEHGINLKLNLNDNCPILVVEDDLYQIIFNLIENAIKYNVPGGEITVSLIRENDNATLTVTDTGVGIPDDALPHIFERFYRVDKARSRKSGGSGLGLSIVKNMVERNRGDINVKSTVGSGTAFTVVFPIFDTEEDML